MSALDVAVVLHGLGQTGDTGSVVELRDRLARAVVDDGPGSTPLFAAVYAPPSHRDFQTSLAFFGLDPPTEPARPGERLDTGSWFDIYATEGAHQRCVGIEAAVDRLFRDLDAKYPNRRYTLIGYSQGGMLASFACTHRAVDAVATAHSPIPIYADAAFGSERPPAFATIAHDDVRFLGAWREALDHVETKFKPPFAWRRHVALESSGHHIGGGEIDEIIKFLRSVATRPRT